MSPARRERGFVLVNALVLVAALSLVAVALLARAESGRQRLEGGRQAARIALGLDGFETLAITLLDADRAGPDGPDVDHPGEAWAQDGMEFALPAGRVSGRITDMQGLFNLNWLADPEDARAGEAFARLARQAGLGPAQVEAITAFLRPGGPGNRQAYGRLRPASAPVGGPVLMFEQIAGVAGLPPEALERLRPYATALDGSTALNVNTAAEPVLRAVLPERVHARLGAALAARARRPFTSVDGFLAALGEPPAGASVSSDADGAGTGSAAEPDMDEEPMPSARLTVGSRWFELDMRIILPEQSRRRITVLERPALPRTSRVAWRLTATP